MAGSGGGHGEAFEVVREFEVGRPPEVVWAALTTGTGGWLCPVEYEPREGGAAPCGGVVARWDPPRRLTVEGPGGLAPHRGARLLDHVIEPCDGGRRSWVRYLRAGPLADEAEADEAEAAAVTEYTDFCLHTLRQYLTYFAGRPAVCTVLGPVGAGAAFTRLTRALGLPADAREGARVRLVAPGAELDAVIGFRTRRYVGLRTDDALYRLLGAPVGLTVHDFAPHADAKRTELAWRDWLTRLYG
ncbi:SRPBCC domain-containing protein [Streptomyces sp. NPDC059063]|uniref:SRPBCC family protein n=1 Tax=unclassified Streptomyces TaxID=2593676 RepID=UPI0036A5D075